MESTQILVREHRLILRVLEQLETARDKLERGVDPPREFFENAVEFCRRFADRYHHYKEEYLMFGMLSDKGHGGFDQKLSALRFQHERNRNAIGRIENALEGYGENDEIAVTTVLEFLASYISLLKRHINFEDRELFPMVESELSPEDKSWLISQFEKEEQRIGGEQFWRENRQLLQEMGKILTDTKTR